MSESSSCSAFIILLVTLGHVGGSKDSTFVSTHFRMIMIFDLAAQPAALRYSLDSPRCRWVEICIRGLQCLSLGRR